MKQTHERQLVRTCDFSEPCFLGWQQVLSTGLKRIRHYGLLANPCAAKLAQAKEALNMPAKNRAAQDFMTRVAKVNISQCPACEHGRLRVVQTLTGCKRLLDAWGKLKPRPRPRPQQSGQRPTAE